MIYGLLYGYACFLMGALFTWLMLSEWRASSREIRQRTEDVTGRTIL